MMALNWLEARMGAIRKVAGLDPALLERAKAFCIDVSSGNEDAIRAEVERWERASLQEIMDRQMELMNEWQKDKLLPSDEFGIH
ncbi:type II toxin-antitoxin system CcdA family antitoxin [Aerophototrophica crusticola]|uniref:Type II toxin-antitoxin system CcdA family antitoxin n=1 Tax=Aerophototrophica crusticola TaxID=1709002 RepID=A0A858R4R3_9PROT|nr:type II toxin-antitoxin system CcdA family antitoxin [Rhodospirillaceae bacterium B3]